MQMYLLSIIELHLLYNNFKKKFEHFNFCHTFGLNFLGTLIASKYNLNKYFLTLFPIPKAVLLMYSH